MKKYQIYLPHLLLLKYEVEEMNSEPQPPLNTWLCLSFWQLFFSRYRKGKRNREIERGERKREGEGKEIYIIKSWEGIDSSYLTIFLLVISNSSLLANCNWYKPNPIILLICTPNFFSSGVSDFLCSTINLPATPFSCIFSCLHSWATVDVWLYIAN